MRDIKFRGIGERLGRGNIAALLVKENGGFIYGSLVLDPTDGNKPCIVINYEGELTLIPVKKRNGWSIRGDC